LRGRSYKDVGFRFLSANQQPNFWTIAAFRRRHHHALGELFVQTARRAQKAGLVRLNHVAVDGTKIKANASKHSAMSYQYMLKEEERLKEEIERYLREVEETDAAEDRKFGKRRRGDELPEHLRDPKKRLEAIRRAKAELEAEAKEKAAEKEQKQESQDKGRGKRKRAKEIPPGKAQYNFTDPDSRIMLSSENATPSLLLTPRHKSLLSAELSNQAADAPHLIPVLDRQEQNTGCRPKEVSADAGYFSERNLEELSRR